jgi:hypothetical protein
MNSQRPGMPHEVNRAGSTRGEGDQVSRDEAVRHHVMRTNDKGGGRRLVELDRATALELLASMPYGRVVFTQNALPAIRPVNHLVDRGRIIIRTRLTSKLATSADAPATVVAYEADQLDPVARLGWSVVITGYARPIIDPAEQRRLEAALTPWVDMAMDTVIAIEPEIVTGYRLTPAA